MGLEAIYRRPKTSQQHPAHPVYPYLLKGMVIDRPNQVWCADITFIPVRHGFFYLVAIMDWATRKVLAWRLSNTMHADFCVEALKEAIAQIKAFLKTAAARTKAELDAAIAKAVDLITPQNARNYFKACGYQSDTV